MQSNRARSIFRGRHIDLEFDVASFAVLFKLQFLSGIVRRANVFDKKRVVQSVRVAVLDGNRAVDAVPGADELRFYRFSDVNRSVGAHINLRVEVLENKIARGSGQRGE